MFIFCHHSPLVLPVKDVGDHFKNIILYEQLRTTFLLLYVDYKIKSVRRKVWGVKRGTIVKREREENRKEESKET